MLQDAQAPPTKASLKAWWNHFTSAQRIKREGDVRYGDAALVPHTIFGKPLGVSLKTASVQISTANADGELYIWGYIPVVVAKCGLYLKENATEVEGTFRVNGSNKRMRELQAQFEAPPRYGKSLDWKQETYTTHDVASVFRRYLTQMPEPVIPHKLYHEFREPLAKKLSQEQVITTYKRLIRRLPPDNQYLLLYVLDLLSVFARKSDKNLMTATNLAVIFRPGIISYPDHEMLPHEHALSQQVLEFLIAQQDWFMLDIPPPPHHEPGSPLSGTSRGSDIDALPTSDDEHSHVGGGWKLIGTKEKSSVVRRRTTIERSDRIHSALSEGDMSPVPESPSSQTPSRHEELGTPGVARSRTLPPSRRRGGSEVEGGGSEQRTRVLRKQKRASSSQPSRTGTPSSSG